MLYADVAKLHGHWWSGMQLQCQKALGAAGFLVVVDQHSHLLSINVMGEVKILGLDADGGPVHPLPQRAK